MDYISLVKLNCSWVCLVHAKIITKPGLGTVA